MVRRMLTIHVSVRGDTTYKPGAQEPACLRLCTVSHTVLTRWVSPGRLLNFLEPQCSPGKNDDDNSTNLVELP